MNAFGFRNLVGLDDERVTVTADVNYESVVLVVGSAPSMLIVFWFDRRCSIADTLVHARQH